MGKLRRVKLTKLSKVLLVAGITMAALGGAVAGAYSLIDTLLGDKEVKASELVLNKTITRAAELRADNQEVTVTMSGDDILQSMNQMTHQKVHADQKWGAVEMTKGNIGEVKILLEKSNFTGKDKKILSEMLDRWEMGNFENIVQDHNTIWNMQGGSIGVATDKMTAEEEKEYVRMFFSE